MQRFQISSGKQLFDEIVCKKFDDVCCSEYPTIFETSEGCDKDKMKTLQFICASIIDYLGFKNRKNTMTTQQVMQTAILIFEEYPYLKLNDLKLFVRRLKLNVYGEVYDLDGQVFIGWLNKYVDEKRIAQSQIVQQREGEIARQIEMQREKDVNSQEAKSAMESFFRHMDKIFKHTNVNAPNDVADMTEDEIREKVRLSVIRQHGARLIREYPDTYADEVERLVEQELKKINS